MATQIGDIRLYSLKELSNVFKVTIETLRYYLASGRIKGRKMGTRWFVTEDSLREYFGQTYRPKRITLQGIAKESTVTDEDIDEAKGIWR
ncbi:MAG: helix-turn-helix domain-containing protein [bacterium]|nr:helix-turn-helix domain-containing protein [bacterium]